MLLPWQLKPPPLPSEINSQQPKYGAIPKEISGRCRKFQSQTKKLHWQQDTPTFATNSNQQGEKKQNPPKPPKNKQETKTLSRKRQRHYGESIHSPSSKKNSLQPYKHKNKQEAIITPRKHRHPNNGKLKSNATETYSLQPNKRTKQQTSKQKNTSQNETPTWEKKTIKKFPWEHSRPSRRKEERRKKREEKQR